MFYLTKHSTDFYLQLYRVRHVVNTTQIAGEKERKLAAATTWDTLFS